MTTTRSTLLQRLRESPDDATWEEFHRLYEPLLSRYTQSHGLSVDDSRDVVQNIFASLVKSMRTFELMRERGRFRTYLWRVTHNAIADWARRRQRRRAAEEVWSERLEASRRAASTEPDDNWDEACRKRVLEFSLATVKEETNAKTWACFEQHLLKNRSGSEVAEELGVRVGSVYVNASRVMERVRQRSAEYLEDLDGAE